MPQIMTNRSNTHQQLRSPTELANVQDFFKHMKDLVAQLKRLLLRQDLKRDNNELFVVYTLLLTV